MRLIPTAIGYLRSDVSGIRQSWDETQIRSLAGRLGYNLTKTVAFSGRTCDPVARLITMARDAHADAVITPGITHFDGAIPAELDAVAAVITVAPKPASTFGRSRPNESTASS
ncbi:hypothetical protein OG874_14860 [Nocardia sp. NBC_00565]|uniref:hypothetical protein n=1 Tax=Nocardia sp. NBC_00565 TaxID=2975993 RepID=UPI002E8051A0|nr:hypothetical protein [Nocardia sp. NBC_00565]WUC06333.1 hypothetical protein OG874_14860 [Nocardia sp. NBC_00565]